MVQITSFEILDEVIKKIEGKPAILEALWKCDIESADLFFYIYTKSEEDSQNETETRTYIGQIVRSRDSSLFTNGKRTVVELAKELGKKACEKYGLLFYFPAEEGPDDECPKWTDRHLAICCANCTKLIIPANNIQESQYVCHNCQLKKESNDKIQNKVLSEGVLIYLYKNGVYDKIRSYTSFEVFSISNYLSNYIPANKSINKIEVFTINQEAILKLAKEIESEIEKKIPLYEKPELSKRERAFYSKERIEFKGNHYELVIKKYDKHREIYNLYHDLKEIQEAILGNYIYKIYSINGITYRNHSILRFINYTKNGITTINEVNEQYKNILTEDEIGSTLKGLQQIECINILDNRIEIIETGRNII